MTQKTLAIVLVFCAVSWAPGADKASEGPTIHPTHKDKPMVTGWASARVEEKLNRGMIAVPTKDGKVYLGWRLLKTDPDGTAFNVYRSGKDDKAIRLNKGPVTATTDFIDEKPVPGKESSYWVTPVVKDKESGPSEKAVVTADPNTSKLYYTSIKEI
jgi:hypothetical protein